MADIHVIVTQGKELLVKGESSLFGPKIEKVTKQSAVDAIEKVGSDVKAAFEQEIAVLTNNNKKTVEELKDTILTEISKQDGFVRENKRLSTELSQQKSLYSKTKEYLTGKLEKAKAHKVKTFETPLGNKKIVTVANGSTFTKELNENGVPIRMTADSPLTGKHMEVELQQTINPKTGRYETKPAKRTMNNNGVITEQKYDEYGKKIGSVVEEPVSLGKKVIDQTNKVILETFSDGSTVERMYGSSHNPEMIAIDEKWRRPDGSFSKIVNRNREKGTTYIEYRGVNSMPTGDTDHITKDGIYVKYRNALDEITGLPLRKATAEYPSSHPSHIVVEDLSSMNNLKMKSTVKMGNGDSYEFSKFVNNQNPASCTQTLANGETKIITDENEVYRLFNIIHPDVLR